MNNISSATFMQRQSGAALVIALVFLLMLTLLGLSSSQVSIQQERMAGNYLEWSRAHQAAERALRDLERQVTLLADHKPSVWNVDISEWQDFPGLINFRADCTLETLYGDDWSQAQMSTFGGTAFNGLPAPEYLVVELREFTEPTATGGSIEGRPPCYSSEALKATPEPGNIYLITVRGFGPGDASRRAEAMVQSIFYRGRI